MIQKYYSTCMHFYVGPTGQSLPRFMSHVTNSMMSIWTVLVRNMVYHTNGLLSGCQLLFFCELKIKLWTLFGVLEHNLFLNWTEPKWNRKTFIILIGIKYISNYQSYKLSSDIKKTLFILWSLSNGQKVLQSICSIGYS